MNIQEFWAIIEKVKKKEEPEEAIKRLFKKLAPEELISYQKHFDSLFEQAYQWNLWGAAFIIEGGCSDDGFTDFRYGLISKGRTIFENSVVNPDTLANFDFEDGISNELFGYSALEIYEEKTGNEMPRDETTQTDDPVGEEWDFDDEAENAKRLPQLWAKYGN